MGENLKSISHTNVCRNINTHKERDRKRVWMLKISL